MAADPSLASALPAAQQPSTAAKRPPYKLLIAGAAALITFAYLIVTAMGSSTVYYLTVAELHAKGNAAYQTPTRVGGRALDGSIQHDLSAQTLKFTLVDSTGSLPVIYQGIVPDMFGYATDGHYQDAVVEGKLHPDGVFYASQIIVKHDATFAAADATATAGVTLTPQPGHSTPSP
jgi:cytochrome c-type biogenesis protein CcmE